MIYNKFRDRVMIIIFERGGVKITLCLMSKEAEKELKINKRKELQKNLESKRKSRNWK